MQRIEVITSTERRRRFTADEKRRMVEEGLQPGFSLSATARKYGITPSLIFNWKRLMEKGQLVAVGTEEEIVALFELRRAEAKIRELERVLGKKTMQNEILMEAVRIGREKNSSRGRRCPVWKMAHEGGC